MGFEPMWASAHRISSPAHYLALISRHKKNKLLLSLLQYMNVITYIVFDVIML